VFCPTINLCYLIFFSFLLSIFAPFQLHFWVIVSIRMFVLCGIFFLNLFFSHILQKAEKCAEDSALGIQNSCHYKQHCTCLQKTKPKKITVSIHLLCHLLCCYANISQLSDDFLTFFSVSVPVQSRSLCSACASCMCVCVCDTVRPSSV
jgi:hypothetical protein